MDLKKGEILLISKDPIKGNLNLVILSSLLDSEKYGYEITKQVHALTDGQIQLKEGSLYPALHKLEKQGLIEGYWVQHEPGKPNRKYYCLTAQGRQTIELEKEKWQIFIRTMGRVIYGDNPGI